MCVYVEGCVESVGYVCVYEYAMHAYASHTKKKTCIVRKNKPPKINPKTTLKQPTH